MTGSSSAVVRGDHFFHLELVKSEELVGRCLKFPRWNLSPLLQLVNDKLPFLLPYKLGFSTLSCI